MQNIDFGHIAITYEYESRRPLRAVRMCEFIMQILCHPNAKCSVEYVAGIICSVLVCGEVGGRECHKIDDVYNIRKDCVYVFLAAAGLAIQRCTSMFLGCRENAGRQLEFIYFYLFLCGNERRLN